MEDILYYFITNDCNECGKCIKVCQQNAIQVKSPYSIKAEDCNACGKCHTVCDSGAVIPENDAYRLINRESDSFFGGGVWMIGRKWWEADEL